MSINEKLVAKQLQEYPELSVCASISETMTDALPNYLKLQTYKK